jgi:hypothetical protein
MIDLTGTWLGAFPSFVHDQPPDQADPAPQIAAYFRNPSGNPSRQTDGYFLAATMLCLRFKDSDKSIIGKVKINRGGMKRLVNPDPAEGVGDVTGDYTAEWNAQLQIVEGRFSTIYHVGPPGGIHLEYQYIAKNENALEWVWWNAIAAGAPFRSSVAQGVLTRVPVLGP